MSYVLFDIDHTLADSAWRDQFAPAKPATSEGVGLNWDEYNSQSSRDKPFRQIVFLEWNLRQAKYKTVGLTARPERWRKITEDWLFKHGIIFEALLMRPDHETTPSAILKPAMAMEYLKRKESSYVRMSELVDFVVDDRSDVCEAFRELGVMALQVHSGGRSL